jgi:hypothetical protein
VLMKTTSFSPFQRAAEVVASPSGAEPGFYHRGGEAAKGTLITQPI